MSRVRGVTTGALMGNDHFIKLASLLAKYDVAIDQAYLHGLLTGCATIPDLDSTNLVSAIAGEQSLARIRYR